MQLYQIKTAEHPPMWRPQMTQRKEMARAGKQAQSEVAAIVLPVTITT